MRFEWDLKKAAYNLRKHGISFKEAATVMADSFSMTFEDPDHSINEQRFLIIGESVRGRVLVAAHTDRGGVIRIISAREATRRERKFYEEGN